MPDLEFQSEDVLAALQDTLLREHVRYAAEHSPFYRRLFASTGLRPDAIHSVNDLGALPFTTKSDLETNNPDFLCTDAGDIIDICLSSGTTGKPVALMQTRSDLDRLAVNEDVSFRTAGITARDRVLIATALDRCFMAGLAYFLGLTRIGATAIRVGSGSAFLLLEMLRQQQATAMVGVPTLMLAAAERLVKDGGDPASLGVRRLICIGEPIRNQDLSLSVLGERLRELWGAQVFGTYASTEMATAFCECEHGLGGHQHPDLIAVEIVDEQGRVLPPGEVGEVVATPLQVKGMPLLRFKTGDVAVLHTAPCPCGRRTPRLGPVLGRKAQMLKCRGTTVYPPAIAAVLHAIREVQGYYIEVHDEYDLSDRIRVVVGVEAPESVDGTAITDRLAASLRVRPDVVIAPIAAVQQKTVQSDKRKPVTFFDYRRR
ncbi:MAG: CoF synthetase [Lentisphaerae bacterium RIFOXYB12_FULL_65_16]|nr:MAG: CoF synthetase [Lentisphaerae bacterium RIFOXYA12_64_32]OGV90030.1 MAG: CoF synthetase [Lentisphaerae bacterium RIFOXYB12_FULL_65_16]